MICIISACDNPTHAKGYCQTHYMRMRRYGDPDKILISKAPGGAARAWMFAHVHYEDRHNCLTWPFNKSEGRGQFWWKETNQPASRIMCELAKGPPPTPEHDAAHSCGNGHKACVNPNHLRWATRKENEADKKLHGTKMEGERHHQAKLTDDQVLAIRSASGTLYEIGDRFGISYSMAGKIRQHKNWKHIP